MIIQVWSVKNVKNTYWTQNLLKEWRRQSCINLWELIHHETSSLCGDDAVTFSKQYNTEKITHSLLGVSPPKQNQPKLLECYACKIKTRLPCCFHNTTTKIHFCNCTHNLQHQLSPKEIHHRNIVLFFPSTMTFKTPLGLHQYQHWCNSTWPAG